MVRVGGTAHAVDGMVEWRTEDGVGMGERRFAAKNGNCSNLLTEMSFAIGLQIELLRTTPPTAAGLSTSSGSSLLPTGDSAPGIRQEPPSAPLRVT
jgi:hypothetical protein